MSNIILTKKSPYQVYLKPLRVVPIHWFFKRKMEDRFKSRYFMLNLNMNLRLSPILCERFDQIYVRFGR